MLVPCLEERSLCTHIQEKRRRGERWVSYLVSTFYLLFSFRQLDRAKEPYQSFPQITYTDRSKHCPKNTKTAPGKHNDVISTLKRPGKRSRWRRAFDVDSTTCACKGDFNVKMTSLRYFDHQTWPPSTK